MVVLDFSCNRTADMSTRVSDYICFEFYGITIVGVESSSSSSSRSSNSIIVVVVVVGQTIRSISSKTTDHFKKCNVHH